MNRSHSVRFFLVEKMTFLYILITTLIFICLKPELNAAINILRIRLYIVLVIIGLSYLNSIRNWWFIRFSRFAFLGALLAYWYPETFDINRFITNYDYLLAGLEQRIFGCQPAILFSKLYPQRWFSEVLNMGYFSYYPIIIGTSMYFLLKDKKAFEHFFFIVLFSFFCYYLIYILFPTAGPQYYFQAIGFNQAQSGFFPKIGYFFNNNQIELSMDVNSGFFSQLVQSAQQVGERPTAAFPSSHVGITTLILILIIKNRQFILFSILLPIYLALVAATVYIQAHYLIDVFAGLITAFVLYYVGNLLYKLSTRKYLGMPEFIAIFHKGPIDVRNM